MKGIMDESKAVGHSSCTKWPQPGIAASFCISQHLSQPCQKKESSLKTFFNLNLNSAKPMNSAIRCTQEDRNLQREVAGMWETGQFSKELSSPEHQQQQGLAGWSHTVPVLLHWHWTRLHYSYRPYWPQPMPCPNLPHVMAPANPSSTSVTTAKTWSKQHRINSKGF
jgi:hypothetical protein